MAGTGDMWQALTDTERSELRSRVFSGLDQAGRLVRALIPVAEGGSKAEQLYRSVSELCSDLFDAHQELCRPRREAV